MPLARAGASVVLACDPVVVGVEIMRVGARVVALKEPLSLPLRGKVVAVSVRRACRRRSNGRRCDVSRRGGTKQESQAEGRPPQGGCARFSSYTNSGHGFLSTSFWLVDRDCADRPRPRRGRPQTSLPLPSFSEANELRQVSVPLRRNAQCPGDRHPVTGCVLRQRSYV
jgi:hypothetical protein